MKGTIDKRILREKQTSLEAIGFVDADFAGDLDHRRSTTSYVFIVDGGPVTLQSIVFSIHNQGGIHGSY